MGSDAKSDDGSLGHSIEVELNQEAQIAIRKGPKVESAIVNVSSFTVSASLLSSVRASATSTISTA